MRERLEAMLAAGQDTALLRFSLGNEYLKAEYPKLDYILATKIVD